MEPIETVFRRRERELLRLPNVTAVGVTQLGGKDALVVFVTHKIPESRLRPEDVIPKFVDGYPTDVRRAIELGTAGAGTEQEKSDE